MESNIGVEIIGDIAGAEGADGAGSAGVGAPALAPAPVFLPVLSPGVSPGSGLEPSQ